jgi:hypothetical protein
MVIPMDRNWHREINHFVDINKKVKSQMKYLLQGIANILNIFNPPRIEIKSDIEAMEADRKALEEDWKFLNDSANCNLKFKEENMKNNRFKSISQ